MSDEADQWMDAAQMQLDEVPGMRDAADFLGGAPDEVRPPAVVEEPAKEERVRYGDYRDRLPRSPSQVTSYERCSWSYYLGRIERVPRAPAWWSSGGSGVHLATEIYDQEEPNIGHDRARSIAIDTMQKFFENEQVKGDETGLPWRFGGGRSPQLLPWWQEKGPEMLDRWVQYRDQYPNERMEVIEGEVREPVAGVPMLGRVDRVSIDTRTGEPKVIDVKAGSRTPSDPFQLVVYVDLYSKQYTVRRAAYWMARKGEIVPFTITEPMILAARRRIILMHNAERRGVYVPTPGDNCRTCDVAHGCEFNVYKDDTPKRIAVSAKTD